MLYTNGPCIKQFKVGDNLLVEHEQVVLKAFGSIILKLPLAQDHAVGTLITKNLCPKPFKSKGCVADGGNCSNVFIPGPDLCIACAQGTKLPLTKTSLAASQEVGAGKPQWCEDPGVKHKVQKCPKPFASKGCSGDGGNCWSVFIPGKNKCLSCQSGIPISKLMLPTLKHTGGNKPQWCKDGTKHSKSENCKQPFHSEGCAGDGGDCNHVFIPGAKMCVKCVRGTGTVITQKMLPSFATSESSAAGKPVWCPGRSKASLSGS